MGNYKGFYYLLFVFWWLVLPAWAQDGPLSIGKWQVHVPYNRAKAIAEADGKIYCATEDGFFYYDLEYNQVKPLSKSDGFHSIQVSTLGFDEQTQSLVIVHEDTHLDIVREGEIIPITDIARKAFTGGKSIHHINFHNKRAYLSGTFGVVVLDLEKLEIKDTYNNLGDQGQVIDVYASTTLHDSIYLATSNGLKAAPLFQANLQDYKSWRSFGSKEGLPATSSCKTVAAFNNSIYAGFNGNQVYRFTGKSWLPTAADLTGTEAYSMVPDENMLLIATRDNILALQENNTIQVWDDLLLSQPRFVIAAEDQTFWVADFSRGLVHKVENAYTAIVPAGPFSNQAFSIYSDTEATYILEGGYNQLYEQRGAKAGFYEYKNNQWTNYTSWLFPDIKQFPAITDLTRATRNPVNQKLYIGSYGGGLLEWNAPGNYKVYNPSNSPLLSSLPGNPEFTRVPDVAADALGNIWVLNRHQLQNLPGLHVLKSDNTWQSFVLSGVPDGSNLERIVIDNSNYKWLAISKNGTSAKGLLVFDELTNRIIHLTTGNNNLPGTDVFTLAKDQNGAIWVGTNNGLAIFSEPSLAFESNFGATIPVLGGQPVLEGQTIRAIAVDGGNRKWVGTDVGLWLFNEDGDRLLANFTAQNSPLLSDKIIDIALNHKTGEVFIATDAGVISYRGTATITEGKPNCATVFPNPVRPDYDGLVGISGLPNNANVKITDSAGRLVYETKAAGGTVAWNPRDVNGRKVTTGVYLVFSSNPDGSQKCISKVAVVR